jgi:isopentenyl-diphosphate delta-isomerase type 1
MVPKLHRIFRRLPTRFFSAIPISSTLNLNNLNQKIILVNEADEELGPISKLDAHKMEAVNQRKLHRAFSLFVVDSQLNLLLQMRSACKHTFPNTWSNTVCSHPAFTDDERKTAEDEGVRKAARRRLKEELGIWVEDWTRFQKLGIYTYTCPYNEIFGEAEGELTSGPRDSASNGPPNTGPVQPR